MFGPAIRGPASIGNAGAMEAPNDALQEGFVAAEEELPANQSSAIVWLAPQQLGCGSLKFDIVRQIAEGGNKCCERAVRCIGLAGGTLGKRGCQFILAHQKMRPGTNMVEAPQMIVARAQENCAVKQSFRFGRISRPKLV